MEEKITNILEKKLKNFEVSCNLFDLPPSPPSLQRSYKALCACGNITHVYNKERLGGICCKCIDNYKRHKL